MADYIYLLQNRLTPAQWRALEAVREAARAHSMPVFLVGGAVRDLTSGSPVRDLDFALQGDPQALVPELTERGAIVAGENPTLSSVYLTFRGGVRAELGPSLTVSYPTPGKAETQPASILDDLRRRDFTANAMAVSLNEGSYGLLLDPLNGTADIENRELRLVSAYGFIEQPALLLRAARLTERLGWNLEERTQGRYGNSKEEGHIQALPAFDRGYEIEEILHEEDPLAILDRMAEEGWANTLFPALEAGVADRAGLDHVRDYVGQLEGQGLHPDSSAVNFPFLTAKLKDGDRQALKALLPRKGFVQQIETLEARSKELGAELTSKSAAQPSDAWKLLMNADPEVVLYLAVHTRGGSVQNKLKAFLKEWPHMRAKIPYALMQEMRITPDLPEYEKLLDDLFFALIDGKLDTPEATRAFLEPFSPPAPPQVTVRRRPAKSARGRGRKAAAEVAEESGDETERSRELPGGEEDEPAEAPAPKPAANGREAGKTGAPASAAYPEPGADAAAAKAAKAAPSKKTAGKPTEAKAAGVPPVTAAPAKAVAAPAKDTAKSAAKKVAPAKAEPAPAKKTPPAKPTKAAAKPAQKSASAKAPAAPAKQAAKVATKGKSAPAPAKKVAAKAPAKAVKTPAKKLAGKTAAKKQVAKAAPPAKKQANKAVASKKAVAPAKKGAPGKAAVKKTAAKGRR